MPSTPRGSGVFSLVSAPLHARVSASCAIGRIRSIGPRRALGVVLAGLVTMAVAGPATAGAQDEIAWMYDPDAVVEMHLGGLSEEELDALEAEPDEYQKGTFELKVDGVTKGVPLVDVGIRRKGGFGSSRPIKTGKSGLKVRFDEFVDDQFFFGIKRLTLNNMVQDESMVHEALTYELFHALDLPASRTGYAFITRDPAGHAESSPRDDRSARHPARRVRQITSARQFRLHSPHHPGGGHGDAAGDDSIQWQTGESLRG